MTEPQPHTVSPLSAARRNIREFERRAVLIDQGLPTRAHSAQQREAERAAQQRLRDERRELANLAYCSRQNKDDILVQDAMAYYIK